MIKAFIIDQAVIARRMLANILTHDDELEIRMVGDSATGVGGLLMFDESRPNLVLINVEATGGMELSDIIKEYRKLDEEIKILAIVTAQSQSMVVSAIDAGANDFISKPYRASTVRSTIRRVFDTNKP